MKRFITFFILLTLSITYTWAQLGNTTSNPQPVKWQFSVVKSSNDTYRFDAKATIDKGYHIWAQDAGGDGSLIPTSFTAEQLQNGDWQGEWKESKKPKLHKFEEMEDPVYWHEAEIVFSRTFKGKKGDKIRGAVQYQSCNDVMCFPPTIENFFVVVAE
jgi:hypothetical protein